MGKKCRKTDKQNFSEKKNEIGKFKLINQEKS